MKLLLKKEVLATDPPCPKCKEPMPLTKGTVAGFRNGDGRCF